MTINERDYVQSLARGLAVLRGFENRGPSMTLAEVADAAQISRPAARRILLTLAELGYVHSDNGSYALSSRILTLGQTYLSSLSFVDVAQGYMKDLAAETNEAVGLTTLDGGEIVFVARVGAQRIMSSVLVVGSRLPAYATSMGRVLLADLPRAEQEARLRATPLARLHARPRRPTSRRCWRSWRRCGATAGRRSTRRWRTVFAPSPSRSATAAAPASPRWRPRVTPAG